MPPTVQQSPQAAYKLAIDDILAADAKATMSSIVEQLTTKFPNITPPGFEGAVMQKWIGDQVEAYRRTHEQTNEEATAKDVPVDQQQTTLNGVLLPVNSTVTESSFVFGTLAPFKGATEVEAADDLGCALVSLNTAMNKMGYEPFSLEEVHRAHDAEVRAQPATWKYSPAD